MTSTNDSNTPTSAIDLQTVLNGLSLPEASKYITNQLKDYGESLALKTKDLEDRRKEAQEKYNLHNDGDASENAPLEEAIRTLKKIAGEQYRLEIMKRRLAGIEDKDYRDSTIDINTFNAAYDALTEEDKSILASQFGLSDTSPLILKENVKRISGLDTFNLSKGLVSFISVCDQINQIDKIPEYNSCGIVLTYSTVRLQLEYKGSKSILTYKIYPNGVSILDRGIMAENCKVAEAIMNKVKGYTFTINKARYELLDVY